MLIVGAQLNRANWLQVATFSFDESDMDHVEANEASMRLISAGTDGHQPTQTVDPETHARLEALLEAAGTFPLCTCTYTHIYNFT